MYTMSKWELDGTFKAVPGEQIEDEIYYQMLNCMPPKDLDQEEVERIERQFDIHIVGGFLMGEPSSSNDKGLTYLGFIRDIHGNYYFVGECNSKEL